MIAVLIALYGAGMMMMVMLVHMVDDSPRKWAAVASIFFWPFVIVTCYIMAAIEIISEAQKDK